MLFESLFNTCLGGSSADSDADSEACAVETVCWLLLSVSGAAEAALSSSRGSYGLLLSLSVCGGTLESGWELHCCLFFFV